MTHISTPTQTLKGVTARAILQDVSAEFDGEPFIRVTLHVIGPNGPAQRGLDEYPYSVLVKFDPNDPRYKPLDEGTLNTLHYECTCDVPKDGESWSNQHAHTYPCPYSVKGGER